MKNGMWSQHVPFFHGLCRLDLSVVSVTGTYHAGWCIDNVLSHAVRR